MDNGSDYMCDGSFLIKPIKTTAEVIVVTDPGKTNMATIVGTTDGRVLQILEFSGKDMENVVYCKEFKDYLMKLLKGLNVVKFYQEKPIMKNPARGSENNGYSQFHSQMILTEVRSHLRELAYMITGKIPEEINNWAWKKAILPEGYRGIHQKGSKLYFTKINPMYADYTHDVTDVICMYLYEVQNYRKSRKLLCTEPESSNVDYSCCLAGKSSIPSCAVEFEYNDTLTLTDNVNYIANRTTGILYSHIGDKQLSVEDYMKYSNKCLEYDTDVYLIVRI